MTTKPYDEIVAHYEQCLGKFGVSAQGMDWPNEADLLTRFKVMLDIIPNSKKRNSSILDIGCGGGLLLDFIKGSREYGCLSYRGIDVSEKMIDAALKKNPNGKFSVHDILEDPLPKASAEYIIMNGVLTEKLSLTQDEMEAYSKRMIKAAFLICEKGLAFNTMSIHLDWLRDDLFHWPLDKAVSFLTKECSRNIIIRMDYGLYEYTVYLYKEPLQK